MQSGIEMQIICRAEVHMPGTVGIQFKCRTSLTWEGCPAASAQGEVVSLGIKEVQGLETDECNPVSNLDKSHASHRIKQADA